MYLFVLFNFDYIGIFMDLLMLNDLVPIFNSVISRIMVMLSGMFIIGIASYFYIGAGLGAGPRDGLMVSITKKTGKSVGLLETRLNSWY